MNKLLPKSVNYYRRGDQVLLMEAGDEFLGKPEEYPDAELVVLWMEPLAWRKEADEILHRAWFNIGVSPVTATLRELRDMGGVFAKAEDFVVRFQQTGHKPTTV